MQTSLPQSPSKRSMWNYSGMGRWEGELRHTKRDGTEVVVASRWCCDGTSRTIPSLSWRRTMTSPNAKRAEEELRRSETYLAEGQRLSQAGSTGLLELIASRERFLVKRTFSYLWLRS